MENLNNRITTVQHFLELLRLFNRGKSNKTIVSLMFGELWNDLLKHGYSEEHIIEVLVSDREI